MKKIISLVVLILLLASCSSEEKGKMTVTGKITGFKKGTLYLQKIRENHIFSVDSVKIDNNSTFLLSDKVEEPEVYYLKLDKYADRILFFGEAGEISINSKLEKFTISAKIEGSKNQELYEEYKEMMRKFNDKQLDLIKEKFDAQKINDTALANKIIKEENNLIKRKYLYTTNFGVVNSTYEVAPYIALTELANANVKLLDTINNSLSDKIKASRYGKDLEKYISQLKGN